MSREDPFTRQWVAVYTREIFEHPRALDLYGYPVLGEEERPVFCLVVSRHHPRVYVMFGPNTTDVARSMTDRDGMMCPVCLFSFSTVVREVART